MGRKAVILFNLGGPDNLQAVQPFLFNLFNDPAIIRVPNPFRYLIAKLISKRRAPIAQEIYKQMGGASPIVPQTEAQAVALQSQLLQGDDDYRVFIAMRYWHPRADKIAHDVKMYDPDEVVLLPLYPQYSTTTTQSSIDEWEEVAKKIGLNVPQTIISCYPDHPLFVQSYAGLIRKKLEEAQEHSPRVLFSAHGLPKKIVDSGDPYQKQVELSVAAIVKELDIDNLDYRICYQSRVGPLEWIGPSTDDEVATAGTENKALLVVPVAFVSEHSETLVELDEEYRELAEEKGVPAYFRVPTVASDPLFIDCLAKLVEERVSGQIAYFDGSKVVAGRYQAS